MLHAKYAKAFFREKFHALQAIGWAGMVSAGQIIGIQGLAERLSILFHATLEGAASQMMLIMPVHCIASEHECSSHARSVS